MACTKCQNGMVKALAAEGEHHKWKWVRCPHCNRLETTAFVSGAGNGEGVQVFSRTLEADTHSSS